MDWNQVSNVIFKAIGMAMGVTVIVLNVMGTATPQTMIMLLAIGLAALGLDALQKVK